MKRRPILITLFLAVSLALISVSAHAGAFKTNIGELLLQNLQPGQTYDLKDLLNLPYRVEYEGDIEASVVMTPIPPEEPADMKLGYEAIPDPAWLSVSSTETYVGKKGAAEVQVRISIPNDDKYLGKKYVVYLWARTRNLANSLSVGLGTKSRFLLSISAERSSDTSHDTAPSERASMNFKVEPQESHTMRPLKPGKRYLLGRKTLGQDVVVLNGDPQARTFKLEPVSGADLSLSLPAGYEWPADPKAISFKSDTLVLPPNGRAVLPAFLQMPDDKALRGRKFFYVVLVKPQGKGVTSSIISRYLVETAR